MKPWYHRHTGRARLIVIACAMAGSAVTVTVASFLYRLQLNLWSTTATVAGLSLGGSLLGTAIGMMIVLSIRSDK